MPNPFEHLSDNVAGTLDALVAEIWQGDMEPEVLELCRLRIAAMLESSEDSSVRHPAAVDAGLTEKKILSLPMWPTSELFSDGERAALAFTEKYVADAHSITDEDCQELNRHYSPEAVVNLTLALATFEAVIRSRVVLAQLRAEGETDGADEDADAGADAATSAAVADSQDAQA